MEKTNKQTANKKNARTIAMFSIMIISAAIFAVLCAGIASAAYGYSTSEDIVITLLNQEPDPANPGNSVDLRFNLENYGQNDAENVYFEIIPAYPLSLQPSESPEREVGKINGGQKGRDSVILKYSMIVDKDAIDKAYPIKIKYRTADNKGFIFVENLNVSVRTSDVQLLLSDTTIDPETIQPGEIADLKITLKNVFSSSLRNVRIKMMTNSSSFSTLDSDEAIIPFIGPNEEKQVSFRIIANGDVKSQVHQLSFRTDFTDMMSRNYSKTNTISILINEKPSYMLNLDDTKIYTNKQKGKITISISNTGQSDMKFTIIELLDSDDYEILSAKKEYLGNLESDDFETAEFEIYAKTDKKEVPLILKISYKDSYNSQIEEKNSINLKMYSQSEAKKYGFIAGNGNGGIIIAVIVILGLAYFVFRKYTSHKKKKAQK